MSIHVTMKKKDGSMEEADFRGWSECAEWCDSHHGQYTEIEAHEVSAGDE